MKSQWNSPWTFDSLHILSQSLICVFSLSSSRHSFTDCFYQNNHREDLKRLLFIAGFLFICICMVSC